MKKLILLAAAICGIQIASAQTVTPSTEHGQPAKSSPNKMSSEKKMEKKSGSTGTYTTGNSVPDNGLPADTAMDSNRKPKPMKDPNSPKN